MKYLVLLGRILYSLVFILAGIGHFSSETIHFAEMHGMPMATLLVPFSGLLAVVGGLSIMLGYKARLGAWLLVIFLVPVTLKMHNFWTVQEVSLRLVQQAMFLKNLSMLGAAFLIAYWGSGPYSLKGKK